MLIYNVDAFLGPELDYTRRTNIRISGGKFDKAGARRRSGEQSVDCEGLIMVPGFVNAHTHIGDSIAKDAGPAGPAERRIHPVTGIKPRVLARTHPAHLASFMRASCKMMLRGGITTFVDFREGGAKGIRLLRRAVRGVPIRPVILGRVEFYQGVRGGPMPEEKRRELGDVLTECDGLGISGANENGNDTLRYYSQHGRLRAIHAAETPRSVAYSIKHHGVSEARRALHLRPHFLVHMTHAPRADLRLAARRTRGIVVCPRANAALAEGIPDVDMMEGCGCNVAIGTDNVMVNTPDMFAEMDYLWKVTMGMHKKRIEPRRILKMATANAGRMIGGGVGQIAAGMAADCILIDKHAAEMYPVNDPHAAIVHRASHSSVRAVIVGGKIVHGKI